MLKKLDLYIIKKFLGTFFFALMLFTMVSIIIDLTEKIDGFIQHGVTAEQVIFDYYINFIPYIDALLTPLFVFISVIFFTSKLASNSEIISMYSGGISIYRLMVPYFISCGIIAGILLYANHMIVPKANKNWQTFEYTHLSNRGVLRINRTHQLQVEKGKFLYVENYTQYDKVGYKFSYEVVQNDQLIYKLKADRIAWNDSTQDWKLTNYMVRIFEENSEVIYEGIVLDTFMGFTPKDLDFRISIKEEMQTPELLKHIEKLRINGYQDLPYYLIEYHRRTADVFMTFILTIIGFSIASRKVRGGIGLHIVAGFAISATYILLSRFTTTFSTNGDLPAFFGVWIPNFIFLAVAIYLLKKSQQ